MIKVKSFFVASFFLLQINMTIAVTIYISNSGDDKNNGQTPAFPIKTIEKLNLLVVKLNPGDNVYFERGGVFYGQINLNRSGDENNPLTFGAYGSGKNPVISGSVPVSDWQNYKGNIFMANVKMIVKNVFVNDKPMVLSRYPNVGYLKIDQPSSEKTTGFYDNELNQAEGYWTGSIARMRTIDWAYENRVITFSKNGSIALQSPTDYPLHANWGYYIDNNINELDYEGEWYFEQQQNGGVVYLYPPKNTDINNANIEAAVHGIGFFTNADHKYLIIRDLEFRNQASTAIYLAKDVSDITIENCTFSGQFQKGIYFTAKSDRCIINNCRFYDINGEAIYLLNSNNSIISKCIFQNIGLKPGYGTAGAFGMSAIIISGEQNRIFGNLVNNIGHNGINIFGSGNTIEKNIIRNALLLLNDGGAIKCYGEYSKNSTWKNNFIFDIPGNLENTASNDKNKIIAHGIYLDELTNNFSVAQNTITGCGMAAIGLNACYNIKIENNISYKNLYGINFYQYKLYCRDNLISNNVFWGSNDQQFFQYIISLGRGNVPGIFSKNYYANPLNINGFRILSVNVLAEYSFEKWKTIINSDQDSRAIVDKAVSGSKLFVNMSDDSQTVALNNEINYKDLNLTNVYGSLKLNPWSSRILFANYDINKEPDLTAGGSSIVFGEENGETFDIQWYYLTGKNLQAPVIITAPKGFGIGLKANADFSQAISLSPIEGNVDNIIFVKFSGEDNNNYDDYITNSSKDISINVKVNGNSR